MPGFDPLVHRAYAFFPICQARNRRAYKAKKFNLVNNVPKNSVDGGSAELAEVTLFFQRTAQLKRLTLDFHAGAVGHFVRFVWLVTEISTIQTLASSAQTIAVRSEQKLLIGLRSHSAIFQHVPL